MEVRSPLTRSEEKGFSILHTGVGTDKSGAVWMAYPSGLDRRESARWVRPYSTTQVYFVAAFHLGEDNISISVAPKMSSDVISVTPIR